MELISYFSWSSVELGWLAKRPCPAIHVLRSLDVSARGYINEFYSEVS
jgi:hypothetical protein